MADDFPIDVAQIVALFLESLFYGLYLVSFGMCMYTMLLKSRSHRRQRNIFLFVALLLFVFATLDVALLLRHILDAFVWYHGPGGAKGEFADISYWVNAMKTVTYVAQTSIADAMLIYRCFIVYGRNWLIAAPLCVLWVAGMIVEAFACYVEFTLHSNAFLNAKQLTPFITSLFAITLALNLIATSLIVYRIWSIEHHSRLIFADQDSSGSSTLRRAIRIVIESGLMYSTSVFILFIVYFTCNNASYGVSDAVVQIIGIAFNLIIIRIDQGKAVESTFAPDRSTASASGSSTHRTNNTRSPTHRSTHLSFSTIRLGRQSSIIEIDRRRVGVGGDGSAEHAISMVSFKDPPSSPDEDRGNFKALSEFVKAPA